MFETSGLSTKFLKRETFSGSHCGLRYTIKKTDDGIKVFAYPEPWSFENTPDENKTSHDFPFSEEGVNEAIAWLENLYTSHRKFFDNADKNKMANMLSNTFLKIPE